MFKIICYIFFAGLRKAQKGVCPLRKIDLTLHPKNIPRTVKNIRQFARYLVALCREFYHSLEMDQKLLNKAIDYEMKG